MKKTVCLLLVLFFCSRVVYAMDLDGVKQHFLKGEWKDAIYEGEKLLAHAKRDSPDLDELYYYLGLCYFKDGKVMRSTDIFEIVINEFPQSRFAVPARRLLNEAQAAMPAKPATDENGPDLVLAGNLEAAVPAAEKALFWIQVGAFSNGRNADNLVLKLRAASYKAEVSPSASKGTLIYKVRVGPYYSGEDAQSVSKKLGRQGYPTKVVP